MSDYGLTAQNVFCDYMCMYCFHSDRFGINPDRSPSPTEDLQPNSELIAGNGVPVPKSVPPPVRTLLLHNNDAGLGPVVSDLSGRWWSGIPSLNAGGGKHVLGPPFHVPPI